MGVRGSGRRRALGLVCIGREDAAVCGAIARDTTTDELTGVAAVVWWGFWAITTRRAPHFGQLLLKIRL